MEEIASNQPMSHQDQKSFFNPHNFFLKRTLFFYGLFVLLVVVSVALWQFLPGINQSTDESNPQLPALNGQPIIIPETGITLRAENSDSAGIETVTSFILAGKNIPNSNVVKSKLTINPDVELNYEDVELGVVRIIPAQVLGVNTTYQFNLDQSVDTEVQTPLQWAFQTKSPFKVLFSLPNNKSTGVPLNSGIEVTFSDDRYVNPENFISISPALDINFERHKKTAVFVPEKGFTPATIYTITIKKELGIEGSDIALSDDFIFSFETEAEPKATSNNDSTSYFDFSNQLQEVNPQEQPTIGVFNYNYEVLTQIQLNITVFKYKTTQGFIDELIAREQIPMWAEKTWSNHTVDQTKLDQVAQFTVPVQKSEYQGYVVFPDPLPEGDYMISAEYRGKTKETLIQVTPIAAYTSTATNKTIVWTHDVINGNALDNVSIEFVRGSVLAKSNGKGFAEFTTPAELINAEKAHYFLLKKDNHLLVIPVNQTYSFGYYQSWGYSEGGWYNQSDPDYYSYLYVDRELYHPTDTIKIWGVVKNRNSSNHPNVTVSLTRSGYWNYASNQVPVKSVELTPNDFGVFMGEIAYVNLQSEYYSLELKVGDKVLQSKYLDIHAFTKPSYKLEVKSDKKAVYTGETTIFTIKVSFYEGTPLPGLAVAYRGLSSGEGITNDQGEVNVSYTPSASSSDYYPTSSSIYVRSKNTEEGDIETQGSVQVFHSSIALSSTTNYTIPSLAKVTITADQIDLTGINANSSYEYIGDPIANQKITGEVLKKRWDKYEDGQYYDFISKKTYKKYRYEVHSEKITDIELTTDVNGNSQFSQITEKDYWYEVNFLATDSVNKTAKTTAYVYHNNLPVTYPDSTGANYYLEVLKNDNQFTENEEVGFQFKHGDTILPTETDHYLWYTSQNGIKSSTITNSGEYQYKFESINIPNTYIKAVYFDGKTYHMSDIVNMSFDELERKLNIEVTPNKNKFNPGDKVVLDILALDKYDRKKSVDVSINVVDESIYALQEQYFDILNDLFEDISSGILQSYASHQYPVDKSASEMGASCFTGETKILMADGTQQVIKDIQAGDQIQTLKDQVNPTKVNDTVTKVDEHVSNHLLIINQTLRVTPEHRFVINGQWLEIGKAHVGDKLINSTGGLTTIDSIDHEYGEFAVYNLHIAKYKTFIAAGLYVHNSKGDRSYFVDNAYFGNVRTDENGKGKVEFTMPDNITSWRVTYQGVSSDIYAGQGKILLPVTQELFTQLTLSDEYLTADKPILQFRTYGTGLSTGTDIEYEVTFPTLGVSTPIIVKGNSYVGSQVDFPTLTSGMHTVVVITKANGLTDKITRNFKVVDSRLLQTQTNYETLTTSTKIANPQSSYTKLYLTNKGKGKYLSDLQSIYWNQGDRIDQIVASNLADELLANYYKLNNYAKRDFDLSVYQQSSGGIGLFPYSGSDAELTAKLADIAPNYFDSNAMISYFERILNDKTTTMDEGVVALYGLSSLKYPVLSYVQSLTTNNLTPIQKLYIGLALAKMGDKQNAAILYKQVVEQYGEVSDPYARINVGVDSDDTLVATTLATMLGSVINDTNVEKMITYVQTQDVIDYVFSLEKIAYISQLLPKIIDQEASFSFTVDGATYNQKIVGSQAVKIELTPFQADNIEFSNINGEIEVAIEQYVPLKDTLNQSEYFSINRTYFVDGKTISATTILNPNSVVKVELNYAFTSKAFQDGCYQVTDTIPSGLRPITRMYVYGINYKIDERYPYQMDDRSVKYCVYKNNNEKLVYYLRPLQKGEFVTEAAIMQSLDATKEVRLTDENKLVIK